MANCLDINYLFLKNDGTVEGLEYSGDTTTITLDQSCCNSYNYDYINGSCIWNTNNNDSVKIVLNPVMSGGTEIGSLGDICRLDISFDYLLEFDSDDLITLDVLDVFNNIEITASLDKVSYKPVISNVIYENNETLTTVKSSDVLKITNIASYLSGNTTTGLRIVGDSRDQIINNVITSISSSTIVIESSFNSCWLKHSFSITDEVTIDSLVGEKLKLCVSVNSVNSDFALLLDNISILKSCESVERTDKKIIKCPGFNLERVVDNRKSWTYTASTDTREYSLKQRETFYKSSDSGLVVNTKEIDLQIDPALAIEQSVFSYVEDNYVCLSGNGLSDTIDMFTTPIPSIGTTEEFIRVVKSELIDATDRKILYTYPTLRSLYDNYVKLNLCGVSQKLNYSDLIRYSKQINNNWLDIIEQLIPATTIWGSANIYRNTVFDDNKFKYKSYSLIKCNNDDIYGTPFIGSVDTGIEVIYNDISLDGLTHPVNKCGSLYITDIGSNPEYRVTAPGVVPPQVLPFIMEIDTTKGTGDYIDLPLLQGYNYDFEVNYGDNNTWYKVTSFDDVNSIHSYASGGTYTVNIKGYVGGWSFNNTGEKLKVTKIIQWGDCEFKYITSMFIGCVNLIEIPSIGGIYAPETLSCANMFNGCENLIGSIPESLFSATTNVTNLSGIFYKCTGLTETIPAYLFSKNTKATNFNNSFAYCGGLTGSIPSILFSENDATTDLSYAFFKCINLTGSIPENIFSTNTKLVNISNTFAYCSKLSGTIPEDLFSLNTELTNLSSTLFGCSKLSGSIPETLFSRNIKATNLSYVLGNCILLSGSIPTNLFNKNVDVTDLSYVFVGCVGLTGIIPESLFSKNTKTKNFSGTFDGCTGLSGSIPSLLFNKNAEVTNFNGVFNRCRNLTGLIPGNLFLQNTEVTNFSSVFSDCTGLTGLIPDLLFGSSVNAIDFRFTFKGCRNLIITNNIFTNQQIISVINWRETFNNENGVSPSGVAQDIWTNSSATNKLSCFKNCTGLTNYASIPADWK